MPTIKRTSQLKQMKKVPSPTTKPPRPPKTKTEKVIEKRPGRQF